MLAAGPWADFMAKVSESLALLPLPWTGGNPVSSKALQITDPSLYDTG